MSDSRNGGDHGYCVLHVDDDPLFLDLAREFIERAIPNVDFRPTTDIEEATEILAAEPIACVVSDYEMPGMDGLAFLDIVRAEHPQLPFILYTGKGSEEIASEAINAGVTGYLQKGGQDQHRRLANRIEHAVAEYRACLESQRHSTVLEALSYPIYVVDETERFRYVNDAFAEFVGYDRAELIGNEPAMVKSADSVERINDIVPGLVSASGPDVAQVDVEMRTRDGSSVHCRDHVAVLPFEREFRGCAGILRDRTGERRRKTALQRKNERLEKLVSGLSHDLQTHLKTAQTAVALINETGEDEHMETLTRSHDRLEEMLDGLATLAREGERVTATEPVEVDTVAREAWQTADTVGASLRVGTDAVIEADPEYLRRLFGNLFDNAIAHAGPGVTVTVDAPSGGETGFAVMDDGRGVPAEHRDSVFDPGFTTAETGSGFGLAIIERIADAHGWTVRLTDGPDGGARFEFGGVTVTDPVSLR